MIKRSFRWALLVAVVSVAAAVTIGLVALSWDDDASTAVASGPIEGDYAYASTTLLTLVPGLTGRVSQPLDVQAESGRMAIGADGHVFWSLQLTWPFEPSRNGRLSCEGSYDRVSGTIAPSPRFGFTDFPPVMERREVVNIFYNLFCTGSENGDGGPVAVSSKGHDLQFSGSAGTISWRHE